MPPVRLFVSTITPDNGRQAYFLETLLERLHKVGIEPVRLHPTQFHRLDPIGYARNEIKVCHGLFAIGLERSHAYFLRDREGTSRETEETHRRYTSGWLHLEAGIAHALGLDVFVLCQVDICNDGIFDRKWNTYPVTEIASLDDDSPDLMTLLDHLAEWAKRKRQEMERGQSAG